MGTFTFLKSRKPKQFEYRPRFYDPEAEEREMRKKAVLGPNYKDNYKSESEKAQEKIENPEDYNPGQYVNEMRIRRGVIADRRKNPPRVMTVRLIIALVGLILLGLWLFR